MFVFLNFIKLPSPRCFKKNVNLYICAKFFKLVIKKQNHDYGGCTNPGALD